MTRAYKEDSELATSSLLFEAEKRVEAKSKDMTANSRRLIGEYETLYDLVAEDMGERAYKVTATRDGAVTRDEATLNGRLQQVREAISWHEAKLSKLRQKLEKTTLGIDALMKGMSLSDRAGGYTSEYDRLTAAYQEKKEARFARFKKDCSQLLRDAKMSEKVCVLVPVS